MQIRINNELGLQKLLNSYLERGEEIKKYTEAKGLKRFSYKKFVADLGEYYFYTYCNHLFIPGSLKQSEKATAPYDFEGIFIRNQIFKKFWDKPCLIEVKTRHAQVNDPYLLGIKLEKFQVLAFVFLNENYSCNYISLIDRDGLQGKITGKQNRLIFKDDNIEKIISSGKFEKIIPTKSKGV